MKKITLIIPLIFITIVFLMIFLSIPLSVLSQIPGEFTIGNADPTLTNFEVQEADGSWDSVDYTTHVSDTALRWDVDDINGDSITTTICIGTVPNPSVSGSDCNIVNYQFSAVPPGTQQTYTYNTDPVGTLQGVPDTINFAGSDCSASPCVKNHYVDIIIDDGQGGVVTSSNYFDLTDYLPSFVNFYMSDDALIIPDSSCLDFMPVQHCLIDPNPGDYTSVNLKLRIDDQDADCSDLTHSATIVLCFVDAAGAELCDDLNNADRTYSLPYTSIAGTECDFDLSVPVSNPSGIEFYQAPGFYKMYIESGSQAGLGTTGFPPSPEWEYGSLSAPLFPTQVYLGDRVVDGGDGIQLDIWNPGLSLATIVNEGNTIVNMDWEATDPSSDASTCTGHTATCWDLSTTPDLQIDDDIDVVDDTGNLAVVSVPEGPLTATFEPVGGLQICTNMACDTGSGETLDTYFHIRPPLGLGSGVYQTTFTVTI